MAIYKAFIIKLFSENYLSTLIYVCISVLILYISILIYYHKSSLFNEHHLNKYFLSRDFLYEPLEHKYNNFPSNKS